MSDDHAILCGSHAGRPSINAHEQAVPRWNVEKSFLQNDAEAHAICCTIAAVKACSGTRKGKRFMQEKFQNGGMYLSEHRVESHTRIVWFGSVW